MSRIAGCVSAKSDPLVPPESQPPAETGRAGFFIVFEGGEGAGKTTQIQRLKQALESRGEQVLCSREPGGSPLAEQVRSLVLENEFSSRAELMLFLASRAEHTAATLRPALESGQVVLCDRYHLSTLAYQGGGLGLEVDLLRTLSLFSAGGLEPDLTLILDLPPRQGLMRRTAGSGMQLALPMPYEGPDEVNRIDNRALAFHEKVRDVFVREAQSNPQRVKRVNAAAPEDEVHRIICKLVDEALQAHRRESRPNPP